MAFSKQWITFRIHLGSRSLHNDWSSGPKGLGFGNDYGQRKLNAQQLSFQHTGSPELDASATLTVNEVLTMTENHSQSKGNIEV